MIRECSDKLYSLGETIIMYISKGFYNATCSEHTPRPHLKKHTTAQWNFTGFYLTNGTVNVLCIVYRTKAWVDSPVLTLFLSVEVLAVLS